MPSQEAKDDVSIKEEEKRARCPCRSIRTYGLEGNNSILVA